MYFVTRRLFIVCIYVIVEIAMSSEYEPLTRSVVFSLVTSHKATWRHAWLNCESVGKRFASIKSQEDQDRVSATIRKQGLAEENFWVGGTDQVQEPGHFKWVGPERFTDVTYTYWKPNQPNSEEQRHCLMLTPGDLMWEAGDCQEHRYYICEADKPSGN